MPATASSNQALNPAPARFGRPRTWADTRHTGPAGTGATGPCRTGVVPMGPHEVALLRGGPRAAVTVAVVALHLRGAVRAGRPGTLRKAATPAPGVPSPYRHPLEQAVRVGLYRPAGIRELVVRAAVRNALARMRADLAAAGQWRVLPPGPTRAARRHVAALRERHPLHEGPGRPPEEDVLLAVALYGDRALLTLVPRFTRRAGLIGRGGLADEGLFPFGRGVGLRWRFGAEEDPFESGEGGGSGDGGHSGGGGFGCGGGGGGGSD
ncbi:TIGR04222 domain-containing membrane protein [Streptomyces sp. TRM S81-3]|uniref:TIGR04222 domain-containing membrane protein n=1 Tax=Streptomyces griseicoloratus TaxID=2752516 RepID=A0A926L536_9ACTN|nr:TIGR04222 domain-containing membrane protein [Streptomyces griseicoloratus]MBD0422135.1 TIGR04222 domain-containing membrane protein [Streptomyces griseicoloratus]